MNTLKASPDELIALLSGENAVAEKCPEDENYIILKNTGAVEELKAYKAGFFHVQDISCGKAVKRCRRKPAIPFLICALHPAERRLRRRSL